jgi:hypothetical protein
MPKTVVIKKYCALKETLLQLRVLISEEIGAIPNISHIKWG